MKCVSYVYVVSAGLAWGSPGNNQRNDSSVDRPGWQAPRGPHSRRERWEGPPLGKVQLGEGVTEWAAARGAAGWQALDVNNFVSNKCFGLFS